MTQKMTVNRWLLGILIIAGLLRVVAIIITYQQANDDWEYGEIAYNLAEGRGFSRISDPGGKLESTSSHAPLYTIFLSIFYSFGQTSPVFLIIKLMQFILSIITILFFYRLVKILFDKRTGLTGALILAMYPPYIYNTIKITPIILFITLLIITVYMLFKKEKLLTNALAGILVGGMILCDPIGLLIIPVYVLLILINKYKREPSLNHAIFFATLVLILAPWTIRNYIVHKRIVPITTQFSINFWIGNNPMATGTDYYRIDDRKSREYIFLPQTLPRHTRIELSEMTERERADFFFGNAIGYIYNNPTKFMALLMRKTFYYWWFAPAKYSGSTDSISYRAFYALCYLPILILGLIGIIHTIIKGHRRMLFISLSMILIASVYIITHVGLARYRLPVEVLLIIPAAYSVRALTLKLKNLIRLDP